MADAIFDRDYPVLQGFIIFIAIGYALINLAVDVSYSFIDPRVRVSVTSAMLPPAPERRARRRHRGRRPRAARRAAPAAASGATSSGALRRNPTRMGRRASSSLVFVLVAVLAPWLAPVPARRAAGAASTSPRPTSPVRASSPQFPLGLDRFGGDVLSKLIWGAQASLIIGVVSTALRPHRRHAPRAPRRHVRRLGRQRHHALRRHPALGAEPAARRLDRRDPRPDPVSRHDRDRRRAGADLRAPAALVDAAAAQRRLRAVRADARPRPRHDHDEPRAAELGRARSSCRAR